MFRTSEAVSLFSTIFNFIKNKYKMQVYLLGYFYNQFISKKKKNAVDWRENLTVHKKFQSL